MLPFFLLFFWDSPLTPFWLELHHVQFTVFQLTAHLDLCNVYQQHSLVPTYSSYTECKQHSFIVLPTLGWVKSSARKQYGDSSGKQSINTLSTERNSWQEEIPNVPSTPHSLPREPRQTQILQLLRLRVAAHTLQRQNITNNKWVSCYFGFPVILLLSVFRWR